MHAADIKKSERLKRVDNLLSDGKEYTTYEIIHNANVCAVNSIISELRCGGRVINCRREKGIWYYRRDILAEKKTA